MCEGLILSSTPIPRSFFKCFYECKSAFYSTFPESVYCTSFIVFLIHGFIEVNIRITTPSIIYIQAPFWCLGVFCGKLNLYNFEVIIVEYNIIKAHNSQYEPFNVHSHVDTRSRTYVCLWKCMVFNLLHACTACA